MDAAEFSDSPVGQLVPISGRDARFGEEYDAFAFNPEPLPHQVTLSSNTWTLVGDSMLALGRLDQACLQVPNPERLRRPAIRREAVSTSALEGTHAAFTDVLEADVGAATPMTADLHEVLNYVRAADLAFASIHERDLSVNFVSELQSVLTRNTASDGPDRGRLRTKQVLIGPEGCRIDEARFVPPPQGDLLEAGMRQWADWVTDPPPLPAVVLAALGHYQFETLHPFSDGNGRIGRLVVVLQLMKSGALRDGLLTISPWLEARRQRYQDELLAVSMTGDWDPWVRFFAEAIKTQAESTVERVKELLELKQHLLGLVHDLRLRGVAVQVVDDLIGQPMVSARYVADAYDVTYPAANGALGRLVEAGVLEELTGRNYGRIFACRPMIAIMDR